MSDEEKSDEESKVIIKLCERCGHSMTAAQIKYVETRLRQFDDKYLCTACQKIHKAEHSRKMREIKAFGDIAEEGHKELKSLPQIRELVENDLLEIFGESIHPDTKIFVKCDNKIVYNSVEAIYEMCSKNLEVLTINSHFKTIWTKAHLIQHTINKDIYKVCLNGNKEVVVTGDHSLFIRKSKSASSDRTFIPCEVRNISINSPIATTNVLPLGIPTIKNIKQSEIDYLRFIGFWLGDGSYESNNSGINSVRLALERDNDLLRYFCKFIDSMNLKYETRDDGSIRFNSRDLIRYMLSSNLVQNKADRNIPDWIMTDLSNEEVKYFLQGLFSANGSITANVEPKTKKTTGHLRLASINKRLLEEVQILLLRFGIESNIGAGYVHSWGKNKCYNLNISAVDLFYNKIGGFIQEFKTEKLKRLANIKASRRTKDRPEVVFKNIKSIENLGNYNGTFYDFEVPDTQNFVLANGIIAHNTGVGKSLLVADLALSVLNNGENALLIDTERNLPRDIRETLKGHYIYTPYLGGLHKAIAELPDDIDFAFIDSVGMPILTQFSKMNMKERGEALLKLTAILGDLKEWTFRSGATAILTNQPVSEMNLTDSDRRPFGDKSQYVVKEIWKLYRESRGDTTTSVLRAYRSRSMKYGEIIAFLAIDNDGLNIKWQI